MAVSEDGTTVALLVGGVGTPLQVHTVEVEPDGGLSHGRAPIEIEGRRGVDQVALSPDGRVAGVATIDDRGRTSLHVVSTIDRAQARVVSIPIPGEAFGFDEGAMLATGEGSCAVDGETFGQTFDEQIDAQFLEEIRTAGSLQFAGADTLTFDDGLEGLRWELDLGSGEVREDAAGTAGFAAATVGDVELSAVGRWLRVQHPEQRAVYLGYESFSPPLSAVAPDGEAVLWADPDGRAWVDRSLTGGGLERLPIDFERGIGQIAWLDEARAIVLDHTGAVTFTIADGRVLDEIEASRFEPPRYDSDWRAMMLSSYYGKTLIEVDDAGRFGEPIPVSDPAAMWGFLPRTGDDAPAIWTLGDVRRFGPVPIEAQHPDGPSLHAYTLAEIRSGVALGSHPELARLDAWTEVGFGPGGERLLWGFDRVEITNGAGTRTLPVAARHVEHTGDDLLVQVVEIPRDLLAPGEFGGVEIPPADLGFLVSELESDTLTVYDASTLRPRWSLDVGVPIVEVAHDEAASVVAVTTDGGGVLVIDGDSGAVRTSRCGLGFSVHRRPPPHAFAGSGSGSVCQ